MEVIRHPARSALRKIRGRFPYDANLNVYTGCSHGCVYCFAQCTEGFRKVQAGNFFADIQGKDNIAQVLDRELSRPAWRGKLINLGGVTDSYQESEVSSQLMPEVWKVLLRHRNPVVISTKSSLILRDVDLIAQLSRDTFVNVASTIVSLDAKLCGILEPQASAPLQRFDFLKQIKAATKASVGVHIMPILPYLTDSEANLTALWGAAVVAGLNYTTEFPLHLRGIVRGRFFSFLQREFPDLVDGYTDLYRGGKLSEDYRRTVLNPLARLKARFPLEESYLVSWKTYQNVSCKGNLFFDF